MYQTYIPGRGPYPALFPIPLAHPSPLRPGDAFLTGPGLMAATSSHTSAPILSIPSMAALRAKMEKDNAECLNLVKKDGHNAENRQEGQKGENEQVSSLKSQSQLQPQLQAVNRPVAPAEFTRFTIDEILGKNEETRIKEDPSDDELSSDEIEVVRCNSPDSESGKTTQGGEDGESLVFGSANIIRDAAAGEDPSARFSWLQCTRYKPPKLPRKFHYCLLVTKDIYL